MQEISYKDLKPSGIIYQETIDQSYPQGDYHNMYVGKIEKVLVYRVAAKLGDCLIPTIYKIAGGIIVSLSIESEVSAIIEFT